MKALSAAFVAISLLSTATAGGTEPPPGASSCSGCHAVNAAAETPVPAVQGRNAAEIMNAMTAFRDGSKPATVMTRIAKGFTDHELRPIADWLGSQSLNEGKK